jgi:hypothetical protein
VKDFLYIALTVGFFGGMQLYVRVCAALAAADADAGGEADAGGTR